MYDFNQNKMLSISELQIPTKLIIVPVVRFPKILPHLVKAA
jgi:hypothetical protein